MIFEFQDKMKKDRIIICIYNIRDLQDFQTNNIYQNLAPLLDTHDLDE
jgi:hypothetical protein